MANTKHYILTSVTLGAIAAASALLISASNKVGTPTIKLGWFFLMISANCLWEKAGIKIHPIPLQSGV